MKILIAEDDSITRHLLLKALQQWGHEVTAVANGQEAIEVLRCNRFEVLLTDWMMPVCSGIELTKAAHEQLGHHAPWIIMITSKSDTESQSTAIHAGVDDYLQKPFDTTLLEQRLLVASRWQQRKGTAPAIPMCVSCKQVQPESAEHEQWQYIEEYLHDAGVKVSVSFCEDCHYREAIMPAMEHLKSQIKIPNTQESAAFGAPLLYNWLEELKKYERNFSPGLFSEVIEDFFRAAHKIEKMLQVLPPSPGMEPAFKTEFKLFRTRSQNVGAFRLSSMLTARHLDKLLFSGDHSLRHQLQQELQLVTQTLESYMMEVFALTHANESVSTESWDTLFAE